MVLHFRDANYLRFVVRSRSQVGDFGLQIGDLSSLREDESERYADQHHERQEHTDSIHTAHGQIPDVVPVFSTELY